MTARPSRGRSLTRSGRAAIFDVDETLIVVSGLFRFLRFEMDERGRPRHEYEQAARALRALAAGGAPREDVNRAYFQLFAGREVERTAAAGERWFEHERRTGGLFHPQVLAALWRHAAAGDLTVLVSGSFAACLDPIARFVGADLVLCTLPEIRAGRYTGRVAAPMVGEAKAEAVRAAADAHDVLLAESHAYGDHASDLPLLDLVGQPVVVGDDPVLTRQARSRGWLRLPRASAGTAAPPRPGAPADPADLQSPPPTVGELA
jgi:HAD superfamily hydrolase (TIGR01490 family)